VGGLETIYLKVRCELPCKVELTRIKIKFTRQVSVYTPMSHFVEISFGSFRNGTWRRTNTTSPLCVHVMHLSQRTRRNTHILHTQVDFFRLNNDPIRYTHAA